MKRFNFNFIPKPLKRWILPLVVIAVMLFLGYWFEFAWFILFAHHLFWIISIFLLINPVIETFWPSSTEEKSDLVLPNPSAKARQRAEARKHLAKQGTVQTSETAAERLAHLRKEKAAVDKRIESLNSKPKVRNK